MFDQNQTTLADRVRATLNWWLFLTRVGAVSVEVFLHNRFGQRYCRLQAFMVIPLGLLYAWMWDFNGYDIQPLLGFFAAYVGALMIAQIGVARRLRRGDQEHSYYNGHPILLRPSLARREMAVKRGAEPLFVGSIGILVNEFNRPLGTYLIFAGCALFVSNWMLHFWRRRQVIDLQDAVYEQQQVAGSFRSL